MTDDAENNTTVVAGFDKTANQTLSGNVTFTKRPLVDTSDTALTAQKAANILSFKYKNSVSKEKTVNVIRTYGDAENGANNGTAIIGSSSGQTVISSGEGAPNVMKTLSEFDDTNDKLYAMSDSGIDIYTNCNIAANAVKAIAIAANGAITLATNAITSLKNALGIGTTDISSVGSTVTGAIKGRLTATYNGNEIPFQFAIDSSGNYGYKKAGADTVYPFSAIKNVPPGTYLYNEYVSGNVTRTGNVSKTTYSKVYVYGFFNIQGKGITTLTIKGISYNSYWVTCGIKNNGEIDSINIEGFGETSKSKNVSDYRFIIVQTLVAQVNVTFS